MRAIKNLAFLAISFCFMIAALANEISTVGGTLLIKKEEYSSKLLLGKSPDPILEEYSIEILKKLPYSNTVDFVLIQTHTGGNTAVFGVYLVKISRDKTWKLLELPETDGEASLSREGEYIKVTSYENEGYKGYQVTTTININGEIVKNDKKLVSGLPEIKSFNDIKTDTLPPAALIQLPAVKEDLEKKGLYYQLNHNLDGIGYLNLKTTKNGNTVFIYANGSHAENWAKLAMEADKTGAYFILIPEEKSFEISSFDIYSNHSSETIRQILRKFLRNSTLDWFQENDLKSASCFINGKRMPSCNEIFRKK
ncbi:MAG: hypothetical protein NC211_08565 [Alistipes senegalensis]|nr:hypothetical protein [Oxalobacter formigenes]MCM1281859.1 hypothetical protein [Alistipes senegalensis]